MEEIDRVIKEICSDDPKIKSKIDQLIFIPSVGITLATKVACEVPELGELDFRQLPSLVRLALYSRDSGQYRGKRHIFGRGGKRGSFRKVLYMAAVASLRCNPKLKVFYDRLIQNHKPAKVALVAVMSKLLSFMHVLFKNNSFWCISM